MSRVRIYLFKTTIQEVEETIQLLVSKGWQCETNQIGEDLEITVKVKLDLDLDALTIAFGAMEIPFTILGD